MDLKRKEFIQSLVAKGLTDDEIAEEIKKYDEGKLTGATDVGANEAPVNVAPSGDLTSEDISLESQDPVATPSRSSILSGLSADELKGDKPTEGIEPRKEPEPEFLTRAERGIVDEFNFSEAISQQLPKLEASSIRALEGFAIVPDFVNNVRHTLTKQVNRFSKKGREENKRFESMSPEVERAYINAIYNVPSGLPGDLGVGATKGLLDARDLDKKAKKLEAQFSNYEKSIGETLAEGNIAEGATRILTGGIEALPSLAQAFIPVVGLPSIFATSAAKASDRYQTEEGGRVGDIKGLLYSTWIGASEALLEFTTRRLGINLFKSLVGKSKTFVQKTLKQHFKQIAKEYGLEGSSEVGTEFFNRLADQVVLDKKDAFTNFYKEAVDIFLVGGFVGGKTQTVSSGIQLARRASVNKSIRNTLNETSFNSVNDAFVETNVTDDNIKIAKNKNADVILDLELKRKVDDGDLTQQESDNILNNFNGIRSALSVANEAKISDNLINETVTLVKERNELASTIKSAGDNKSLVAEDVKRLKEVDTRLTEISAENRLNIVTQKVTDIIGTIDKINIEIAENQDAADKIAKDKNLDKKASSQQGFILQDSETGEQTIVINKEISKADQAVNVAAHELLHGILFKTVSGNSQAAINLSNALKTEINKIDTKLLQEGNFKNRLDQYQDTSQEVQAEETLTLFADAVANGNITYNETTFDKIGNFIRRILQQAGLQDIKFNNSRDVFNFIKDYNKSIVKGELTRAQQKLTQQAATGTLVDQTQQQQTDQTIRESRSLFDELSPEELVESIKSPSTTQTQRTQAETALTKQFDLLALKALRYDTRAGDIARENVVAEARAELPGIIDRFNPNTAKFSTFVTNTIAPKAQQIYENARNITQETTSIDSPQARQIADTQTETTQEPETQRVTKIDPTKFERVSDKIDAINKIVDIKPEQVATTTFKEVNDKYASKVASEIFNVPEGKIKDPTKNLTYAKKITDGIPENSEAGNIQDFFRVGQNAENFIKILPEQNVSSSSADIDALGENIDVSRDVLGLSLGINNRLLNYFYNKTNKRSRGKTSQPFIWELKQEFINPTTEVVNKFKQDLGITPTGQLNNYNRSIGQLLKGAAKLQGQNVANLIARNKVDDSPVKTAKPTKQIKADIKSGTSRIMLSMKEDAGKTRIFDKITVGTTKKTRKQERLDLEIKPNARDKNRKYLLYNRSKELPKEIRAFKGETVLKGLSRITNNFLNQHPKYREFLNKALTFGIDRSPFGTQELWDNNIAKGQKVNQASFKKPKYAPGKKLSTTWLSETKKPGYVENEKKKLDDLIGFYRDFNEYYKENKKDAWFLDEVNIAGQNSQGSPLRANAPSLIYEVVPGTKKPLLNVVGVEEHSMVQNAANSMLSGGVNRDNMNQVSSAIKNGYMQGFISGDNNDLLDIDYKSTMPDLFYTAIDNGLKLDVGLLSTIRLSEAGIDLNNIYYIPTNQTLGEYFFNNNTLPQSTQKELMQDLFSGKQTLKQLRNYGKSYSNIGKNQTNVFKKNTNKTTVKYSKAKNNEGLKNDLNNYDKALRNAKNVNAPKKGISVFDFDDTLATTKSLVIVNMPDGSVKKITPAEFAKQHSSLESDGAQFDFSEFNKVIDGKPGPLANKLKKAIDKFGNKDVFVLTARPQASAQAIYEFLKGIGLEVPIKNIKGLEDGTPQAKANWVISKAAEGYNDFYFTDDVYKNVKAVQDALEVLDVKSKTRVAYSDRISKLDRDFNDIIEAKTGIGADKIYSKAKAAAVGSSKGRFTFFIPPSAEDFVGLLYNTLAKGKLGDNQMAWYKKNLLDPYATAMGNISRERISLMNDYKELKKQIGIVPKNLRKNVPGEAYTNEQAVRVYIWNKQGMDIPGLSKTDLKDLTDYVESKPDLKVFGDQLINIQKGDEYAKPNSGWLAGTITTDLQSALGGTKRAKHLAEWQQNVDIIFSEKNLNKMEAAFGGAHRAALEGILERMRTGRNRSFQSDNVTGQVTDWLTNSIGTIMFFNTRSALLQTISAVNFINFKDNNIFKAGKAYANQPQFWSDFMKLMNSDFLVDRRRGLRINVNEADIANMARQSGVRGAISKLLEIGFLPTQIADSFAIASGGATFYRNRIDTYVKQGMSKKEAEAQSMKDFREIAEESQQSSRPDRISMQQAGPLGRIILAFGNTPMQYARLIKKAASDLKNRRGDWKTNVSKIIYYGAVQNLIFNALQQAVFAIAFGDVDEEDEKDKYKSIANGMLDSLLRGIGIAGAFVSVGKNAIIRILDESEKPNPKYEKIGYELTRISPPVSSKLSKINQAARSYQWEKEEMMEKGFAIDNPALLAGANVISAATNIPLDRLVKKTNNVVNATNDDLETWQRLALLGGWQDWEIGADKKPKKEVIYSKRIKNKKTIKKQDRVINRRTID